MKTRPVQISIDEGLLEQVDADPETRERGRSAVIRSALRLYLKAKERRAIDDKIFDAYEGAADALLAEVQELMGGQAWPE